MKRIYFDNAATTPVHPKVKEKILPFLTEQFGNPSSIHSFGREVRVAVEEARELIADFINADPSEIYFTSGGTEADNTAVFGIAKTEFAESGRNKLITSKVEHHAVLESFEQLSEQGFETSFIGTDKNSKMDLTVLSNKLDDGTSLVSAIHVNNESGAINNVDEIVRLAKVNNSFVHLDCVQSFGKYPLDVKKLGADTIAASSHKIYGVKGTGMLYVKSGTPLSPILFGGSQERNRRGGTENIAGIIGFAEAVRLANANMNENYEVISSLTNYFISGVENVSSGTISVNSKGDAFSPYIISVTFDSTHYNNDAEAMLMFLDINGIAVSNGSACTSGTLKPSHVITAMGKSPKMQQVHFGSRLIRKIRKKKLTTLWKY